MDMLISNPIAERLQRSSAGLGQRSPPRDNTPPHSAPRRACQQRQTKIILRTISFDHYLLSLAGFCCTTVQLSH